MKLSTIIIILLCVLMLFFTYVIFFKNNTDTTKNDIKTNSKSSPKNSKIFLKNINFDDGEYALIINHKEKGKFWVDDEKVLKLFENKLKIKGSFINYLPGEGDRSYGLILVKNREVYKAKQGGVFNVFEISNILDFATPFDENFKRISIYKTKEELLKIYDFEDLKDNPKIYMLSLPKFNPNNFEYRFSVYFPSVVVPVHYKNKDTDPYWRSNPILSEEFNEYEINDTLYQKITNEFKNIKGYNLEKGIINGNVTSAYVKDLKMGKNLKNKKNRLLTAMDFRMYQLRLSFFCTKDFYEYTKNYNFDKFISNLELYNKTEYYNKERFYTSIQKSIKNDEKTYSIDDFYVEEFKDKSEIGGLIQLKHELSYWKKINE